MGNSIIPSLYEIVPGPNDNFDYKSLYSDMVASASNGAHFVEIGVFFGRSLIYLAELAQLSNKAIRIDGIDNFESIASEKMCRSFIKDAGLTKKITIINKDQLEASKLYKDNSLDFVFIDSDHSYEATAAAIKAYIPKIKPHGILSGHDYTDKYPGVIRAANEYLPGHTKDHSSFVWHKP